MRKQIGIMMAILGLGMCIITTNARAIEINKGDAKVELTQNENVVRDFEEVKLKSDVKEVAREEFENIETEIIIRVNPEFDGSLNDDLNKIGIISTENIFDIGDTVMYLVKTEKAVDGIIEKLELLPYVEYAEYNQTGKFISTESTNDTEIQKTTVDVREDNLNIIIVTMTCVLAVVGIFIYKRKK
ncbi:MAG: hypothetical protein N4A47_02370 [Clostridia bacterium]|jgi:hypothetical protein|nr:hypothetical protein [Clostridia bacterium]